MNKLPVEPLDTTKYENPGPCNGMEFYLNGVKNRKNEKIDYQTFDSLSNYPELIHGVFTRKGGVSKPPFDGLNIGFSTGDDRGNVLQNREKIFDALTQNALETQRFREQMSDSTALAGSHFKHGMLFVNQAHGSDLVVVTQKEGEENQSLYINGETLPSHCFKSGCESKLENQSHASRILPTADGIISNTKGLLTVIQVADCQGVILYDPICQVVANVHSGWRGSIADILGKTVQTMVKEFGTDPKDVRVGISPSLGPCCAEFRNYRDEIPEHLWEYRIDDAVDNKENHFDFWKMSRDQLTAQGVIAEHIDISGICTPCNTHLFFSYRKEKKTGRFAVVAGVFA